MARPRKSDSKLHAYVRIKSGSYYFHDLKLCRVADGEAAMYAELAKRMAAPAQNMITAAVKKFKTECLGALSPSARKEHARILDVFADEFAEFRVDQVTAADIKRSIRNKYADKPSAARAYKSRISTFFSWAVTEQELRLDNPAREVPTKKPPKHKTPWTWPLFYAVRALLSPMHQCYHDLSFLVYQRTTEIRLLERAHIDRQAGVIRFAPSKTEDSSGLGVDVPITPEIEAVLERAAGISRKLKTVCPFVIHTAQGTPYTRSGIYSAYLRADKVLHDGAPIGLNPKALRPFASTEAKKQGYTIEQLQVGLAHTSLGTTEGYVHRHEKPVSVVRLRFQKP